MAEALRDARELKEHDKRLALEQEGSGRVKQGGHMVKQVVDKAIEVLGMREGYGRGIEVFGIQVHLQKVVEDRRELGNFEFVPNTLEPQLPTDAWLFPTQGPYAFSFS